MATTDTSFKVKNNLIVLGTLTSSFSANVSVTGTVTATSFSGNGALVTSLHANNLTTGTVNTARLGSGTANSTTFLRGDNTWTTVPTSTNLGYSANSINVVVTSDTGTDIVILAANSTVSGVMAAADYSRLASTSGTNTGDQTTITGNAGSATVLQTARTINGTSFNGSANITTASWGTSRTITIGSTGKAVDGSAAVTWTLAEIGAAPNTHVASGGAAHLSANSTANGFMTSSDFTKLAGIASGAQVNVPTNLTYSANATTASIFSDTGTDVIILAANTTVSGVMAAADYSRLASTSGTNTGDQTTITGNAGTATTLQTARTIAISGPITGTATSFNGSANITIPVTAVDLTSATLSGVLGSDHLGTGTANTTTWLRGDGTWQTISVSGATNLTYSANASHVTILSDTGTDASVPAANSTTAGILSAADYAFFAAGGGGSGATNLTYSANATTASIFSDTGSDAIILAANSTVAGVMSAADNARLAGTSGTNTGDQTTITGNAGSATVLQTARTINGTSFNGSANITTASWGTSRTITIGSTGKAVDGSAAVSWTLGEIGAAPASHVGSGGGAHLTANSTANGFMSSTDFSRLVNTSGTNTGDQTTITGNAGSATVLQTGRSIAISGPITGTPTSFNGSADITIPVTSVDLTSATMAGVLGADHLGSGTASSSTVLFGNNVWSTIPVQTGTTNLTYSANATTASIFSDTGTDVVILAANSTVAGVMSAADNARLAGTSGTNTGDQTTITGNAGTATTLQTARTIALSGVATGSATSFNGGANITIPVTALNLGSANNTGTIPTARMGSGTANTTTFLRGDNTWQVITAGGSGSGLTWVTVSSASVSPANTNYGYVMETGGTARTVTLPASVPQGFYVVVNAAGGANVTIVSNGNVIDEVGSGNDLVLEDGDTVALIGKATGQLEILYGRGTVDLTLSSNATNMTILADTGTDVVLTPASGSLAGIMTAADYSRLVNTSGTNTGDQTTITGNAGSATVLQTARTINGTSFNGSANITTASWGTSRTITIGSTGKAVNGSADVSWSLTEIGAPSTTGTGASGTWGINISGVATTANRVASLDTRNTTTTPETQSTPGVTFEFKANPVEGLDDGGSYFGLMTFRKYGSTTDWTGGGSTQLGFTDNGNIWTRYGSSTTWGPWKQLATTAFVQAARNPRVQSVTATTSFTTDASIEEMGVMSALTAGVTINNPTGSPVEGQKLMYRIKDNGTARSINFGAAFRGVIAPLPTTTTISKWTYIGFSYNATDSLWDMIAYGVQV